MLRNSMVGSSVKSGASEQDKKNMGGRNKNNRKERDELIQAIRSERIGTHFESLALRIFRYQAEYNPIYQKYVNLLNVQTDSIERMADIPFLPISFFKSHRVVSGGEGEAVVIFRSSGTTGQTASQHFVTDVDLYRENTIRGFSHAFPFALDDVYFVALLPSYLEREDASLVYMAQEFAARSLPLEKHFYLDDFAALSKLLQELQSTGKRIILLGVTFALLDFATAYPGPFKGLTVIETGGMKGRGPELIREELHKKLQIGFRGAELSSEYGMTELLSQAYWREGYFRAAPTMRVIPREITDPLSAGAWEQSAALNIVDLANIDSCAFIATEDVGRVRKGGVDFEVLGRMDTAEIRGCNLMYASGLE